MGHMSFLRKRAELKHRCHEGNDRKADDIMRLLYCKVSQTILIYEAAKHGVLPKGVSGIYILAGEGNFFDFDFILFLFSVELMFFFFFFFFFWF